MINNAVHFIARIIAPLVRGPQLLSLAILLGFLWPAEAVAASADAVSNPFIVQGSTTFAHRIMEPYQKAIEASCGHKLTVVPNKSSRGLLALFMKRADFAMISGPLQNEIDALKADQPDLPYDRLQIFDISTTRVAFAVNRENPIRQIADVDMRRILLGEITNWHQLGGKDLPIKVVMVSGGGGVTATVEAELLGGKPVKAADVATVQVSAEVLKITQLAPGALAVSQLGLVNKANVVELKTEHPLEQHLRLVTLGPPTLEMRKVIEAAQRVTSEASDSIAASQ